MGMEQAVAGVVVVMTGVVVAIAVPRRGRVCVIPMAVVAVVMIVIVRLVGLTGAIEARVIAD
jgi:hypothetical protein